MKQSLIFVVLLPFLMFYSPGKHSVYEYVLSSEKNLRVGEELSYEVSYSFVKLGKVTLKIKDKKTVKGKTFYTTVAYIDSYPGIPFVDLHQIYESHVDTKLHSDYFRGLVKYEHYTTYTEYFFNKENTNFVNVKKGKVYPPELWTDSITTNDRAYQDGLSIFYYARMNLGTTKTVNVPCFVNEQKVFTKINFYTNVDAISIDNVDYDISCLYLDGETDFVSVFGLTGYFEGWFSNDEASIPIVAKMKVLIGNITLELKEWKREGWTPPKY